MSISVASKFPMLSVRTLLVSPSPSSNQLRRLLYAASRFSYGRGFRLLQNQQMDSFGSSTNSHALSDSPDVIMVGKVPVYLNCKGNQQKSLSRLSVNECDKFESRRDQKVIPSNVPSSYYDDEFSSVSRQYTKSRRRIDSGRERGLRNNTSSFQVENFELLTNISQQNESSLPTQFGKKNEPSFFQRRRTIDIGSKISQFTKDLDPFHFQPFNICSSERRGKAEPRACWQLKGGDTVKITKQVDEPTNCRVLRPGMVLLKHYITLREQVNIVKSCQKHGLGPGGFYQPGFKSGAKLRLQMMCLGLDWDPQTRKYGNKRALDGTKPPDIPTNFAILVKKALENAHALIKNEYITNNIEDILPTMSPDICIVNFYTTSGRLGLHQDRDESEESLISGLPVVSFSVGDSAEFLYGDQRDVDKAEKIVLESGDVLIFGGESRHIFHGVSSIIPNSMPKLLLDRTGLRPGRLNLTFRKY